MENPFSADNKANPFQTPYQQSAAPGIKPFAAVDLAPPAEHNGQRLNAPGNPTASAFTGGDFGNAFLNPQSPSSLGMPPKPSLAPVAAPQAHAMPAPSAPQSMPDYTPVANPIPAAAGKSAILSISDFNELDIVRKPEFFLTTTQQVDGSPIRSFLGVVSVEIVIPKDLLFRNPAPHGEMHRLKAAETELQRVKNLAFEELGEKARKLGADGVVGVTLAFSQFDAVVFLCAAVGTAVKLAD